MATADLAILIKAQNETSNVLKQIQGDLKTTSSHAGSFGKAFDSASKSAGGFGKVLTDVSKIAAGFVIAKGLLQLPGLLDAPVKAASNLSESMNAVQVIFGNASDKILEFGRVSAQQAGLSQRAFNELATPLGAMLKNSGLSMDQVAEKTVDLTKRAADMASVFNTDVDQALGAITAALRGESDPIERYGVKLNAAAIEAEALATGLVPIVKNSTAIKGAQIGVAEAYAKVNDATKKYGRNSLEVTKANLALTQAQEKLQEAAAGSTGKITDQAKAQAALSLLMKQTDAVTGDFVNTSDGLANKQRIVAARQEEVAAQLGQKLIPINLKFKEVQLAVVTTLADKFIPALQKVITYITPFANALSGKIVSGFQTIAAMGPAVAKAFESIREPIQRVVELFALGFNGGQIGGELGTIQTAAFQVGNFFREVMVPAFNDAKDAIHLFFLALQGGNAGGDLSTLQQKALDLGASIKKMWEQDIQPAMRAFADIVVTVVKAINDNWGTIGPILEGAVNIVITKIEALAKGFGGLVEFISGIVQTVDALIHGDWQGAWTAAGDVVNGALALITGYLDAWTSGAFSMLLDAGYQIMKGLLKGIENGWNEVKDFVGGIGDKIKGLKGPIEEDRVLLQPEGAAIMQGLLAGIQSGVPGVLKTVSSIAGQVQQGFSKVNILQRQYRLQEDEAGDVLDRLEGRPNRPNGAWSTAQVDAFLARNGGLERVRKLFEGELAAANDGLEGFRKGLPVAQEWLDTYGKSVGAGANATNGFGSALNQATSQIGSFGAALSGGGALTPPNTTGWASIPGPWNGYLTGGSGGSGSGGSDPGTRVLAAGKYNDFAVGSDYNDFAVGGKSYAMGRTGGSGGGGAGRAPAASSTVNNRNVIIQNMTVNSPSPAAFKDYAMGLGLGQ